jgi:hypothetical protein
MPAQYLSAESWMEIASFAGSSAWLLRVLSKTAAAGLHRFLTLFPGGQRQLAEWAVTAAQKEPRPIYAPDWVMCNPALSNALLGGVISLPHEAQLDLFESTIFNHRNFGPDSRLAGLLAPTAKFVPTWLVDVVRDSSDDVLKAVLPRLPRPRSRATRRALLLGVASTQRRKADDDANGSLSERRQRKALLLPLVHRGIWRLMRHPERLRDFALATKVMAMVDAGAAVRPLLTNHAGAAAGGGAFAMLNQIMDFSSVACLRALLRTAPEPSLAPRRLNDYANQQHCLAWADPESARLLLRLPHFSGHGAAGLDASSRLEIFNRAMYSALHNHAQPLVFEVFVEWAANSGFYPTVSPPATNFLIDGSNGPIGDAGLCKTIGARLKAWLLSPTTTDEEWTPAIRFVEQRAVSTLGPSAAGRLALPLVAKFPSLVENRELMFAVLGEMAADPTLALSSHCAGGATNPAAMFLDAVNRWGDPRSTVRVSFEHPE